MSNRRQPSLVRENAVYFDRQTINNQYMEVLLEAASNMALEEPSTSLDVDGAAGSGLGEASINFQHCSNLSPQANIGTRAEDTDTPPSFDVTAWMSSPTEQEPAKKQRYYSSLSQEDKEALQERHGHKQGSPIDEVRLIDEGRRDLAKASRLDGFKDCFEQGTFSENKVRRVLGMEAPRPSSMILQANLSLQLPQLICASAPVSPVGGSPLSPLSQVSYPPRDSPVSPLSIPSPLSESPKATESEPELESLRRQTSSSSKMSFEVGAEDYFTGPQTRPLSLPTNAVRRRSNIRPAPRRPVSTPLATDVRTHEHEHRREVTFDAFLVPHKAGKGWAYRGAANAKKEKNEETLLEVETSDSLELKDLDDEKKQRKRLSKLPSASMVLSRKSWSSGKKP
jgi:hypothetical protein